MNTSPRPKTNGIGKSAIKEESIKFEDCVRKSSLFSGLSLQVALVGLKVRAGAKFRNLC